MIIALTSKGSDLNSELDLRFGRACSILLYNCDNDAIVIVENTVNLNAAQGAGIQTAQKISETDATVVITGNVGPKAFKVLDAAGIKTYTSNAHTVKEAIEQYKRGELNMAIGPNVEGHW